MDNSSSFSYLGPYLSERGYDVVALDHIGHGRSSHLPKLCRYDYSQYIGYVKTVIDELGWSNNDKFHLIGHSMSSGISMLFASAYPELIDKLVCIDGFGPVTHGAQDSAIRLRKTIDTLTIPIKDKNIVKLYDTLDIAAEARVRTVAKYPGKQSLSKEAALSLISRGTSLIKEENDFKSPKDDIIETKRTSTEIKDETFVGDNREDFKISNIGPVYFSHDARLLQPSYIYYTHEHVLTFIDSIKSKTLLVKGAEGWPANPVSEYEERKILLEKKGLLTYFQLPGSHHLHLDPDHAPLTAETIYSFLNE
jgi:pimeloyl-ACP methyl ester carboxylesterase